MSNSATAKADPSREPYCGHYGPATGLWLSNVSCYGAPSPVADISLLHVHWQHLEVSAADCRLYSWSNVLGPVVASE